MLELIKSRCDGVRAKFAERIDRSPSYVGRMLYSAGKAEKKNISDTLIDVIETKFRLPRGWLDEINHGETQERTEPITKEQQQILSLIESIDPETRKAWLKISTSLAKLNQSVVTDAPKPQSAHGVNEEPTSVESIPVKSWPEVDRRERDIGHIPERRERSFDSTGRMVHGKKPPANRRKGESEFAATVPTGSTHNVSRHDWGARSFS